MKMGIAVVNGPVRAGVDTATDLERANREWLTFTVNES
jgi:CMP-2-keto-3-deoxyoctulosonic acid synthetase